METIKNEKLYAALAAAAEKELPLWDALCRAMDSLRMPMEFATLAGGLDHISVEDGRFVFHDIGVSRAGRAVNTTFAVTK